MCYPHYIFCYVVLSQNVSLFLETFVWSLIVLRCVYRAVGGEVTQDGDFLLFEGNRYDRRGFLYKSFVMSAIVSKSVVQLYCSSHRRLLKFFVIFFVIHDVCCRFVR